MPPSPGQEAAWRISRDLLHFSDGPILNLSSKNPKLAIGDPHWISMSHAFEVFLRIDRRHASASGGRDRLSVDVILDVARGEDPRNTGPASFTRENVAIVIHLNQPLENLSIGNMSNRHKNAIAFEIGDFTVLQVFELDPFDILGFNVIDVLNGGVPHEVDFGVFEGAFLHDLGSSQLVPAVNDRDIIGILGQEGRSLNRRISASHHDDLFAFEEVTVAGCTGRYPVSDKLLF